MSEETGRGNFIGFYQNATPFVAKRCRSRKGSADGWVFSRAVR